MSLPPTRHDLTQGQKPEGRLKWDKGEGRSGTSRDSNPACLCCSSAHLVQCEPDEASSFTNPNVGPGTYARSRTCRLIRIIQSNSTFFYTQLHCFKFRKGLDIPILTIDRTLTVTTDLGQSGAGSNNNSQKIQNLSFTI